jgi:hypothetical protein
MKTDIEILREMFKESAIEPLEKQDSQRNQLILSEPGLDYKVTIRDMPEEYEAIAIKTDYFPSPKESVFKGDHGEGKRSDYAIIVNTKEKKVIVYIELKASSDTSKNKDIMKQLTGAECFLFYCQKIGQLFWDKKNFLKGYETRFIKFSKININKQPTGYYQHRDSGMHDRPERMLKMNFGVHQFDRLIGR